MADTPKFGQSGQSKGDAAIVSEHLPTGYSHAFDGESSNLRSESPQSQGSADPTAENSSLKLQGGDIHRDLFKTAARASLHRRAATFHHTPDVPQNDDLEGLAPREQLAPGGFRRAFIRQRQQDNVWASRNPITRNFVEYLDLYGSFAGEDLAESDDEAVESDAGDEGRGDERPSESRPLLGRRKSSRKAPSAIASTQKTFFTLLKAFIGTGIMFLPKAFNNGGLVFSGIIMLVVSSVTMLAFHLLLQCKKQYGGSYGDLGEAIHGPLMRRIILASLTISQLGFVCAGIVFVAENMTSFLEAIARGTSPLSTTSLIMIQVVLLIPLVLIRNMSKLAPIALVADVCILVGVVYIYYFDIAQLASEGLNETVVAFNPSRYTLTIGAAIFTFEGIGLILPIQSSMAKPQRFEWLLGVVMIIITVLYTSVGALCYATFGADTQIEIINNYPQDNKLVNAVQFLYSLAVLAGTPVQFFPAIRILEGKMLSSYSGKKSTKAKWVKNAFRALLVLVCGVVSKLGAGNLDRFVALIGSIACVPLVYIYPAYLHSRGIASSWPVKIGDWIFMTLGVVAMFYTAVITIVTSFL